MKKAVLILLALTCASTAWTAAKEKKRTIKVPKENYVLYLPGKGNKSDAVKDVEKQGWQTSNQAETHLSLLPGSVNKARVLRFDTTDDKTDALLLPLSGAETRLTVIFKAYGARDPNTVTDTSGKTGEPLGLFGAFVQKGEFQTMLRHTGTLIRGSRQTRRLTADGTAGAEPIPLVDGWHDIRLVFEVAQADAMTSACYVDGQLVHTDGAKHISFDTPNPPINWNDMTGAGNYFAFGMGKAFARYAYVLVVRDDDVAGMTLEDLGKKCKADLVTSPTIADDRPPASKRPPQKPAGVNMTAEDFVLPAGATFSDRAALENNAIDLDRLPHSKVRAQKVARAPDEVVQQYAATVDPTGANGAFKTISAAVAAVSAGDAILVLPGLYYETLEITKPVFLYGTNPATTVVYGYEADTHTARGNVLVTVRGEQAARAEQAATAAVHDKTAPAFSAENMTFYNKGAEWNKAWGSAERRSVALWVQDAPGAVFKNCVFLGQRNTVVLQDSRVTFERCYVEGGEDIISASGAVQFVESHIHVLANGGTVIAPLDADDHAETTALVFRDCVLTADKSYAYLKDGKKITLVRGAQEKTADISHDSAQEAPARISVLLSNTEIPRASINSASPALK